jgi:hypothetical protein
MRGTYFLLLSIGLALVDVLVPYLLLRSIPSFLASYLFWCLLTLAVILFGALYVRRWGGRT